MPAILLKILKNPWMASSAILAAAVLSLFLMLQSSKLELANTQLETEKSAKVKAEQEHQALQKMYDDLALRKKELDIKNRQSDAELVSAKKTINHWKNQYEEAIANPAADEHVINTHVERLFLDLSCATGADSVCINPGGTP